MAVPLMHQVTLTDSDPASDNRIDAGGGASLPEGTSRSSRSSSHSRGQRPGNIPTVIIDNSELFRAGLVHMLAGSRFRVTASRSSLSGLSERAHGDKHCVALISLDGDATAILTRVRPLTENHKGLHIIILTGRFRAEELLAALTAGAEGYLLKNEISVDALLQSLELVLLGVVVIPRGFTLEDRVQPQLDAVPALRNRETTSEHGQPQPAIDAAQTDNVVGLSAREQTILMQLMQGASNKQIARELNIAEATVKVHVKNLLIKIRVKNRTQAATWAMARVGPNSQLEQRPVSFPAGGDREKISATTPNGDNDNSGSKLRAAAVQVHAEIDFKGGFAVR